MIYRTMKPLLFRMDPEKAHHMMLNALHIAPKAPGFLTALTRLYGVPEHAELATETLGLSFRHPIGLAAGLDKNGKAVPAFSACGFAFMEVGTVTPKAQSGNDLPRLFRLPSDEALINRMGFNNEGAEAMVQELSVLDKPYRIPVAVNIGKNKSTDNEHAEDDYRACIRALYPYASLFVVNISSPNTPGLRHLQHGDDLRRLLSAVTDELSKVSAGHGEQAKLPGSKPVLVKIAPDLSLDELEQTVAIIREAKIDGIIATNTTLSREGLTHPHRSETGGLSGKPLAQRSTEIIREVYRLTEGQVPIVGSGGIFTAQDAYEKILAGATLIEVYTALIYEGPGIVRRIADGLVQLLKKDGFSSIQEAVGADHHR